MSTNTSTADIARLGGASGATLGGQFAGFMGPQRPPGYRLRITTGDGDRIDITDINSLSVNRRHTAISDWSATIPHRVGIDERILSAVRLTWGDTILFRGRLESIAGELNSPTVELSGRGIAADLTRGEVDLGLANVRYREAIGTVWRRHTPFSATVIAPDDSDHPANTRISTDEGDGDYSGTPMEVLGSLHSDCGMRFTVLHSRPGLNVESYPIGSRRRRHDWGEPDGGDRDMSAKDYANRVVVTGALKDDGSGERIRAVAEDAGEIALMRDRGIGDDGRVAYPIDDDSITDPAKAQAKADSTLADLVDKDTVGGSLDVSPTVAAPGYQYYVPELGGEEPRAFGEGAFGAGTFGSESGQYASLEKVNYSISRGSESCGLDLSRREGFADALANAYRDA